MQVVWPELACQALPRVLPYSWPEVEEHAEREGARHAVHDAGRDRVMEPEAQRHPAAGAPAPGGVEDPDDRAEDGTARTRYADSRDALEDRARHDRRGRPREKQEREEEDQVDVVGQVRAEGVAPRDAALAGGGGEVARVRADRQTGLVAVVDPPAEVVERRRHDGDREDVLHRRGHRVLLARDAGLVRHEARVDQPHEYDREEVELLAEDCAVERQALGARRVLQFGDLRNHQCDHASSVAIAAADTLSSPTGPAGATLSPAGLFPQRMMGTSLEGNECHNATYGGWLAAVRMAALPQGRLV